MNIESIIELVMQQGVWCALFVYLFYSTQKTSKEREEKLTGLLYQQGKQIENIAHTLDNINERIDGIEERINV